MNCPSKPGRDPASAPAPAPGGTPLAPPRTLPRTLTRKRAHSGEVEIVEGGGGAGGSKPRARAMFRGSARKIQKTAGHEWGAE